MRIGIVANRTKPAAGAVLEELRSLFAAHKNVELLWESSAARTAHTRGLPLTTIVKRADLLIVAGGDGSLLRVVGRIFPSKVPILGLNIGSLGFLTSVTVADLPRAVPLIAGGELRFSPRMALRTAVHHGKKKRIFPCALNDVVVSRGDVSRLVRIRVRVNGEFVNEYVCDGLIVSTATGSTAYSLSSGGPILSPSTAAVTLTPICPHTLTNRSLVVGADAEMTLEIPEQEHPVIVQIDGQPGGRLFSGDRIQITPAPQPVVLAYLPGTDFFHVLRQKLKWSGANV